MLALHFYIVTFPVIAVVADSVFDIAPTLAAGFVFAAPSIADTNDHYFYRTLIARNPASAVPQPPYELLLPAVAAANNHYFSSTAIASNPTNVVAPLRLAEPPVAFFVVPLQLVEPPVAFFAAPLRLAELQQLVELALPSFGFLESPPPVLKKHLNQECFSSILH